MFKDIRCEYIIRILCYDLFEGYIILIVYVSIIIIVRYNYYGNNYY